MLNSSHNLFQAVYHRTSFSAFCVSEMEELVLAVDFLAFPSSCYCDLLQEALARATCASRSSQVS